MQHGPLCLPSLFTAIPLLRCLHLPGICLLCFWLPFVIRSTVILNYNAYRRPMSTIVYAVIAAIVVMRVVGHYQAFQFAIAAYFSLSLGLIFWAASDPMFEMVDWLGFSHGVRTGS